MLRSSNTTCVHNVKDIDDRIIFKQDQSDKNWKYITLEKTTKGGAERVWAFPSSYIFSIAELNKT